jgi:uncharacterized protein YbaR (Trm112 family)
MRDTLLTLLSCPFCGTKLSLVDGPATVRAGAEIEAGVLGCDCCAFPIVAGIPVLIADDVTRDAMHALEAGRSRDALFALLGLEGKRAGRFESQLAGGANTSYQKALALLSPDAEGAYFLYRFSDPTFLAAEALVRAVGQHRSATRGPRLDLCGGSGHLTRALARLTLPDATTSPTVVADLYFWKLWLATRFTAPDCAAVCCDANVPLPFRPDLFSLVVLADAFPYIWHKRLCADDMIRVTAAEGIILMPHLHSAHGDNVSAGDTLPPAAYRALFAPHQPRLFSDRALFDLLLDERAIDLSLDRSPDALGKEATFTLVASRRADLFRRYDLPDAVDVGGKLIVNPLYKVERRNGRSVLTLAFPTPEYEAEFVACRRYLPDTVTVDADLTGPIETTLPPGRREALRRQHVLIDAPPQYY